jgi:hypothetical protein
MKKTFLIATALLLPLSIGCSSNEPAAVVDSTDEIEQYLANNPDAQVDPEKEQTLMEADAAIRD